MACLPADSCVYTLLAATDRKQNLTGTEWPMMIFAAVQAPLLACASFIVACFPSLTRMPVGNQVEQPSQVHRGAVLASAVCMHVLVYICGGRSRPSLVLKHLPLRLSLSSCTCLYKQASSIAAYITSARRTCLPLLNMICLVMHTDVNAIGFYNECDCVLCADTTAVNLHHEDHICAVPVGLRGRMQRCCP